MALVVLALAGVGARGAGPIGTEFQVNTYTTDGQRVPDVAVRRDGSFVVVWDSVGSLGDDQSGYSVQARLLDSGGAGLGREFQVNDLTYSSQFNATAASRPDGSFVVAWEHLAGPGPDPADYDIRARLFDSTGQRLGEEFTVNTYTDRNQVGAQVVALDDSSFVIAWTGRWDGSSTGVHVRSFDPLGFPMDAPVIVNEYTTSSQNKAALVRLSHGGFVATWQSLRQLESGTRVEVVSRELAADLTPVTPDVMVSGLGHAFAPTVAPQPDGGYVVVWTGDTPVPVFGRHLAAGGVAVGAAFQVAAGSTLTTAERTRVASGPHGDFVAIWNEGNSAFPELGPDGDLDAIVGRFFESGGHDPVTEAMVINGYTTGTQIAPEVAYTDDGRILAVWQSDGSFGTDSDGFSIQARFLLPQPFFSDGFEHGDLLGWDDAHLMLFRDDWPAGSEPSDRWDAVAESAGGTLAQLGPDGGLGLDIITTAGTTWAWPPDSIATPVAMLSKDLDALGLGTLDRLRARFVLGVEEFHGRFTVVSATDGSGDVLFHLLVRAFPLAIVGMSANGTAETDPVLIASQQSQLVEIEWSAAEAGVGDGTLCVRRIDDANTLEEACVDHEDEGPVDSVHLGAGNYNPIESSFPASGEEVHVEFRDFEAYLP